MKQRVLSIFWMETVLAGLAALLAILTAFCPSWIEVIFRIDPDHHSGSVEWNLVIVFALTAVFFARLAHRNRRKSVAAA